MANAPPSAAAVLDVLRLQEHRTERDEIAVEEPLQIRVGGEAVVVTMRTPGHDEEQVLRGGRSQPAAALLQREAGRATRPF